MPRKALNRKPLENEILEKIKEDRHPLEYFTDLDYYAVGADRIWNAAYRRLSTMPNYELIGIYRNVVAEKEGIVNFDSYYSMFQYDALDDKKKYTVLDSKRLKEFMDRPLPY